MTTIMRLQVHNNPGVLDRVAGLFRHNGWNIESISAGVSKGSITYINVSFKNRYVDMRLLSKQISRMDFVIDWEECTPDTHLMRELLLIKIYRKDFEGVSLPEKKIIREEGEFVLVECASAPWEIDEFIQSANVLECTRSGVTMIIKGGDA